MRLSLRGTCVALSLTLLVLSLGVAAGAQRFSHVLSFQGRLADPDTGKPMPDAMYKLVFTIYDAETEGHELWQETQTVDQVGGIFNVYLGTVKPFPGDLFANGDRWLGLGLQDEPEMKPRVRLCASPFAVNADLLDGLDSSEFASLEPPVQITGSVANPNAILTAENTGTGGGIRGIAQNAPGLYGKSAIGAGVYGEASGATSRGVEGFTDVGTGVSGYAEDVGTGVEGYSVEGYGVEGYGTVAGGYFENTAGTTMATIAWDEGGVFARGTYLGGYFEDTDGTSRALIGHDDYGVLAYGDGVGGAFFDDDGSGYALVGYGDCGIEAFGSTGGGYFGDSDDSSYAYIGCGIHGIEAYGSYVGGYFQDTGNTCYADLAYFGAGIEAYGDSYGGRFEDLDGGAIAYAAYENIGVIAAGGYAGGDFTDTGSGGHATVARDIYKITGTGTCAFVQNHPDDSERVIVYAAPEGDEVATYTRGTAKLVDGRAFVPLGETFKWVTNPDIGLTAHLTPRGKCTLLCVESLTTEEMVVRSMEGFPDDVVFDYIVYGLRIGFEEVSIVQEKDIEAYIPSMADHLALYERRPELREFNALERFTRMRAAGGEVGHVDRTASQELRDAIVEFDPAIHAVDVPVE